jgi:hypothetical protein
MMRGISLTTSHTRRAVRRLGARLQIMVADSLNQRRAQWFERELAPSSPIRRPSRQLVGNSNNTSAWRAVFPSRDSSPTINLERTSAPTVRVDPTCSEVPCSIFREPIVGIAIEPALAWFRGCDHRMTARLRVVRGVPVRRVVTTQRPAALLARAQVNPAVACFHALLAFTLPRVLHGGNRIQVRAASIGHDSLRVRTRAAAGGRMKSRSTLRRPLMRRA